MVDALEGFHDRHHQIQMKPRRRINPISEARKRLNSEYSKVKREWAKERRVCAYPGCQIYPMPSPHHTRGRLGPLLCDTRFWLPVCFEHHRWIHENITAARALGLICQPGEWNTPPSK